MVPLHTPSKRVNFAITGLTALLVPAGLIYVSPLTLEIDTPAGSVQVVVLRHFKPLEHTLRPNQRPIFFVS